MTIRAHGKSPGGATTPRAFSIAREIFRNFAIFWEMGVDIAPKTCIFVKRKGVITLNARFTQAMPDDLNQRLEKIAEQKGMTKTALINMLASDYVGFYEDPGFFAEIRKRVSELEKKVSELKGKK